MFERQAPRSGSWGTPLKKRPPLENRKALLNVHGDSILTPMRRNVVCAMALLMAGAFGCSRQATPAPKETLERRLSMADRVIVLNPDNGNTKTLKAEQLKKIVQALKESQRIKGEVSAVPGYILVFFTGVVHLETVQTSGILFWIDGKPYHDKSGTVEALYLNPGLGLETSDSLGQGGAGSKGRVNN